jgi:hypothetical protein
LHRLTEYTLKLIFPSRLVLTSRKVNSCAQSQYLLFVQFWLERSAFVLLKPWRCVSCVSPGMVRSVDCIVLGDDPTLKRGKPAPDIFLLAAQRLGASPEECLVFEDAHAGMEAALAAGMSVIVVPHPGVDKQLYRGASQILNSLTDFDPQLWQFYSGSGAAVHWRNWEN